MTGHKKRLAGNFISLSFVQGLSLLFPLIIFPYLLRVLGVEGFGLFTLIQTAIMYLDLLVSFGFGLTATREISSNINDQRRIQQVIASVYLLKLLLFAASVICLVVAAFFVSYLHEHFNLVMISSVYLLGNLLLPDWYFQGIQKMRNIAFIALVSKIISLALVIWLVKDRSDISYAILSMSVGNLIAGVIAFFIMARMAAFRPMLPEKKFSVMMFRESAFVFTSVIMVPLYSSVNIFILQFFTNPLVVGYYAIAEKVSNAAAMLTSIANRTIYPHLSELYVNSIAAYRKNVRTVLKLFLVSFLFLSILQYFFADTIVHLLKGAKNAEDVSYAVEILKIMSVGLFFSPYASFLFQLLIIQGEKRVALRNIFITVVVNIFSACMFAYFYSGKGMAVNYCIVIFVISFLNYLSYRKSNVISDKTSGT